MTKHKYASLLIMEKKADFHSLLSTGAHIAAPLAVHAAQNVAAERLINGGEANNLYKHYFRTGVHGFTPSIKQGLKRGTASFLVPEVGMVSGLVHKMGDHFGDSLRNSSFKGYHMLRDHHKQFLSELASGDFEKAAPKLKNPEFRELAGHFVSSAKGMSNNKNWHSMIDNIHNHLTKANPGAIANTVAGEALDYSAHLETTQKLSKAYKDSTLGKVLGHVFTDSNYTPKDLKGISKASKTPKWAKKIHAVPEIALNSANFAYGDKALSGFNAFKKFLGSYTVEDTPILKDIQSEVNHKFGTKPIIDAYKKGEKGEFKPKTGVKKLFSKYILNPIDHNMVETSGKMGEIFRKAPEDIKKSVKSDIKNKYNEIATPYKNIFSRMVSPYKRTISHLKEYIPPISLPSLPKVNVPSINPEYVSKIKEKGMEALKGDMNRQSSSSAFKVSPNSGVVSKFKKESPEFSNIPAPLKYRS